MLLNPSSTEGSRPTTPPPQRAPPNGSTKSPEAARSPHKARHHVHSPEASPSLPSPMSLFQLGIGSPLRRQMSSPLTRSPVSRRSPEDDTAAVKEGEEDRQSTEPSSSDEADSSAAAQRRAIQDSKDVLVDRLSDLATRLSSGARFEEQEINSFHAKVDEMEQVLSAKQKALDRRKLHGRFVSHSSNKSQDEPFRATGPVTSGWLMAQLSDLSQHSITHDATKPELPELQKPFRMVKYQRPTPSTTSSDIDGRVAVEAEKLCAELSAVVTSLQARREESDHIHEVLLERAEVAARHVLKLERQLEAAEDEVQKNESELSHLRLQLRAIEARCLEYVPAEADHDLLESIENWKRDWASLQKQMTERHLHHEGHSFHGDTTIMSKGPAKA